MCIVSALSCTCHRVFSDACIPASAQPRGPCGLPIRAAPAVSPSTPTQRSARYGDAPPPRGGRPRVATVTAPRAARTAAAAVRDQGGAEAGRGGRGGSGRGEGQEGVRRPLPHQTAAAADIWRATATAEGKAPVHRRRVGSTPARQWCAAAGVTPGEARRPAPRRRAARRSGERGQRGGGEGGGAREESTARYGVGGGARRRPPTAGPAAATVPAGVDGRHRRRHFPNDIHRRVRGEGPEHLGRQARRVHTERVGGGVEGGGRRRRAAGVKAARGRVPETKRPGRRSGGTRGGRTK